MNHAVSLVVDSAMTVFALAMVAAVAAGILWLFISSSAKKTLCIAYLLIGFCLESLFVKQPYLQVGLQVYPNDLISVLVLISIMFAFLRRPMPIAEAPFLVWLAFGGMALMSFVVGTGEYGKNAGTEFRPFFYLWVAGLYCCTADFSESDLRRIARWCVWAAYTFIGIAIYFWIGVESGLISRAEVFDYAGGGKVFRPIGSHATFFVGSVALAQILAWVRGSGTRWSGWHAGALTLFVVVLQHRSVWIAFLVGALYLMTQERKHLTRRLPLLIGLVLVFGLAITVGAGFGLLDELFERLTQSTLSMADSGGTFAARVDGWERLVDTWTESSVRTVLLGFPFGYGYTRLYNGQLIEFAPHNYYIDLVLRVGVIGAVIFVVATLMAIVHSLAAKTESEFEYLLMRSLGISLLAATVYYIAYPSYYILGGATGLALAQIIRYRRIRAQRLRELPSLWKQPLNSRPAR